MFTAIMIVLYVLSELLWYPMFSVFGAFVVEIFGIRLVASVAILHVVVFSVFVISIFLMRRHLDTIQVEE